MRLLSARVENVRKCEFAEVVFKDNVCVIGGDNEEGKSSFLDGIGMAFGGKKLFPVDPIRDGEDEARIEAKIDGGTTSLPWPCTITRTVQRKANGDYTTKLEIVADDEFRDPSDAPQEKLNELLGLRFGFDPLRFTNEKPEAQASLLRGIVGLDFTEMDRKRAGLYNDRTEQNRLAKQIDGKLKQTPTHHEAPTEKVKVADILGELKAAETVNDLNRKAEEFQAFALTRIKGIAGEIDRLQAQIDTLQKEGEALVPRIEKAKAAVKPAVDVEAIKAKLLDAERINRMVDENTERLDWITQKQRHEAAANKLTKEMKEIDTAKQKMISEAKWPIDGLGFGESGGVTYDGRAFEGQSSARKIRVALAIAFSLNPDFPFAIIREGSLLDEKSLAEAAAIADELNGQLLVERVSKGPECHVVFEDGRRVR